jgi:glucuronate isomerase
MFENFSFPNKSNENWHKIFQGGIKMATKKTPVKTAKTTKSAVKTTAPQKAVPAKKPVKAAPKAVSVKKSVKKTAAFLHEDFLLSTDTARELFHSYAKDMPIIDYHCHLPPQEVAENQNFKNLAGIWLNGDHYKWRVMRAMGFEERLITGDAPDEEKFQAWARAVPGTIGNPLYPWTHLELKRYFGINDVLKPETADAIWKKANSLLARPDYKPRAIMEKFKVKLVCTTDDPADDLRWHKQVAADPGMKTRMLPAFRPDKAANIADAASYNAYLETLGRAAGLEIRTYRDLIEALDKRHAWFHENGSRLTDHAVLVPSANFAADSELEAIFAKIRSGQNPGVEEAGSIRTGVLLEVARMNARRNWTMQLHIGALRSVNTARARALGPDVGNDAVNDACFATPLARFFDCLAGTNEVPRTILYSVNQNDNEVLAALIGCFQEAGVSGKMQLGSAWWYNDQRDGMELQMRTLGNFGVLPIFVGMLTDSRSFMSYPRHEYFRRILCNLIAGWVETGEVAKDMKNLGKIVQDISYNNAKNYFAMSGE